MTSSTQATTSEPSPVDVIRWQPLVLTPGKLEFLWKQFQRFPIAFDDFHRGNYDEFVKPFLAPQNVFVDIGPNLGLAAGFAVKPGLDAVLHLVMFDRRLRGREPLFKEIMRYFFDALKLRRMTAMLADDATTGVKLVERLGFHLEGTMRCAILRDGQYHDCLIYGIFREEVQSGFEEGGDTSVHDQTLGTS